MSSCPASRGTTDGAVAGHWCWCQFPHHTGPRWTKNGWTWPSWLVGMCWCALCEYLDIYISGTCAFVLDFEVSTDELFVKTLFLHILPEAFTFIDFVSICNPRLSRVLCVYALGKHQPRHHVTCCAWTKPDRATKSLVQFDTPPQFKHSLWKMMVGRCVSFWGPPPIFSGVFGQFQGGHWFTDSGIDVPSFMSLDRFNPLRNEGSGCWRPVLWRPAMGRVFICEWQVCCGLELRMTHAHWLYL